jgi:hypothetical protein
MGATNYTSTVRLPQFGPSDKPSWQGDVTLAFKNINDALAQRDGTIAAMQAQINALQTQVTTLNAKVGI